MILADKIINLRKKSGLSQEELADKLGVSRQSVSKWESAQSIPDLDKILAMSKIFSVSTDFLLKDEIEMEDSTTPLDVEDTTSTRRVSIETASKFIKVKKETAKPIALAVTLFILSPVILILLSGLADAKYITEPLAVSIGMVVLLLLVAIGVFICVRVGFKLKEYEYLEKEIFETEYGVIGMVKKEKESFKNRFIRGITIGVSTIIISTIPLFISLAFEKDLYYIASICIILILSSIGVHVIVRVCCVNGAYLQLLQEEDYSRENKTKNPLVSIVATGYWLVATAIYLIWSFASNAFDISWIVWVVAGVLFPIVISTTKYLTNKR